MKLLFAFLAVLSTVLAAEQSQIDVVDGNNKFAVSLYETLVEGNKDVLFSPLGMHSLLSMLYQGAEDATKEALAATLQVSDPAVAAEGYSKILQSINDVHNVSLYVANKIFVDANLDLKPDFSDILQTQFSSKIEHVDFTENTKVAGAVNAWVNDETHGKIPELFTRAEFDKDTNIALLNAVYFKGDWKHPFDKFNTRTEPFNIDQETEIEVQMMHSTFGARYKNDFVIDARIVKLTLVDESISMYLILPFEKYGLDAVEEKIKENGLERIFNDMKIDGDLHVAIPKFKLEKFIDFEPSLKQIGLDVLFDKDNCKLSKIGLTDGNLYVSNVKQQVSIEVNEKGTRGTDLSGTTESSVYVPRLEEMFYANQPFLVVLRQDNNIIFYGKIVKPISGDSEVARKAAPTYNENLENFMICIDRNKYLKKEDIYSGCNLW